MSRATFHYLTVGEIEQPDMAVLDMLDDVLLVLFDGK